MYFGFSKRILKFENGHWFCGRFEPWRLLSGCHFKGARKRVERKRSNTHIYSKKKIENPPYKLLHNASGLAMTQGEEYTLCT